MAAAAEASSLPPDVEAAAIRELRSSLRLLRGPALRPPDDDRFLRLFVRHCGGDANAALRMLSVYVEYMNQFAHLSSTPFSKLLPLFKTGFVRVMPYTDHEGRLLVCFVYEKLQRDAVAPEMLVAGLLFVIQSLMRLMVQHPVVQEKGYVLLCQYRNMSISDGMELHESHIKPFRDAYAGILTEVLPFRLHRIYMLGAPLFMDTFWSLTKPFVPEAIKALIEFVDDSDVKQLYKTIPRSALPSELGGRVDEAPEHWFEKMQRASTKRDGQLLPSAEA